jgi:hypothetical protein
MPSADGWPRMPVLPVGPPEMKGIQLVAIGSDLTQVKYECGWNPRFEFKRALVWPE